MPRRRLPIRDPRTVARDIPGVLDAVFPRLTGGLVASLNRVMFAFPSLQRVPEELIEQSSLQRAMLFELAMARAEIILDGNHEPSWDECLRIAASRQRRHYDAKTPVQLHLRDQQIATLAADNLVVMLKSAKSQYPKEILVREPRVPGLSWIASGAGDFSLGPMLIEIKHTDRNFIAADFRQMLMYWLLKCAAAMEKNDHIWTDCLLLNPRRNSALLINFNYLSSAASENHGRIELLELFQAVVSQNSGQK